MKKITSIKKVLKSAVKSAFENKVEAPTLEEFCQNVGCEEFIGNKNMQLVMDDISECLRNGVISMNSRTAKRGNIYYNNKPKIDFMFVDSQTKKYIIFSEKVGLEGACNGVWSRWEDQELIFCYEKQNQIVSVVKAKNNFEREINFYKDNEWIGKAWQQKQIIGENKKQQSIIKTTLICQDKITSFTEPEEKLVGNPLNYPHSTSENFNKIDFNKIIKKEEQISKQDVENLFSQEKER